MRMFKFDRGNILRGILFFIISSVITVLKFRSLGMKDSAMLFLATFALAISLYLIFKDTRKSILLFIISFPLLVTARKAFNIDVLLFRITYESLYISTLFVYRFKNIIKFIMDSLRGTNRFNFKMIMYMGLFLIFALNSSIYSISFFSSFSHTFISVAVPIMFALAAGAEFIDGDLEKLEYALIVMVNLSCLYGLFQVFSNRIPLGSIGTKRHLITFGFHNVNVFAGIAILIFPFILEKFLYKKKDLREGLFLFASLGLTTIGIFITYTRGAWMALLLSGFIVLISRRYRYLIYAALGVLVIGAKPIASYVLQRGTSTTLINNESTIARIQSIMTSFFIMLKYPFGAGSGTFADMYKKFVTQGYMLLPEGFRHNIKVANYNMEAAHNLWLQIGTELGIVCMIVFFIIVIGRAFKAIRNFKVCRAELAAVVSFLIYSFLTGIEFEHKGVITGTLIIWIIFMMIEIKSRGGASDEKVV